MAGGLVELNKLIGLVDAICAVLLETLLETAVGVVYNDCSAVLEFLGKALKMLLEIVNA
jgi:hypothetical protein